jgi:hypothetical protein
MATETEEGKPAASTTLVLGSGAGRTVYIMVDMIGVEVVVATIVAMFVAWLW